MMLFGRMHHVCDRHNLNRVNILKDIVVHLKCVAEVDKYPVLVCLFMNSHTRWGHQITTTPIMKNKVLILVPVFDVLWLRVATMEIAVPRLLSMLSKNDCSVECLLFL